MFIMTLKTPDDRQARETDDFKCDISSSESYRIVLFILIFYRKKNVKFVVLCNTGRFIMFSVITNIYSKKTKRPNLMEFFTATGKLKKFFFYN